VCSTDELSALEALGLSEHDFRFTRGSEAGATLWDQRVFKQTVVRGYASGLAFARAIVNLTPRFITGPRLPKAGTVLSNAFVSHLVDRSDSSATLISLVSDLRGIAARRGIDWITLGFAADDPRLRILLGHFRGRKYRSRLYTVCWPEMGGRARELDSRVLAPEAALL
jgi:hypothetical protein